MPQNIVGVEKDHYTEEDYLLFGSRSSGRWEYVGGQIRVLSSGTDDHSMIVTNIGSLLGNVLTPKGQRTYLSGMKFRTGDGVITFPDVSAVCGERQYHLGRADIITNPVLVVEVLSESAEGYDRGEKFGHYQTIPTLIDYLLVAQEEARVMLYTRHDGHWRYQTVVGLENGVHLPSVDVTLALADVYALIDVAA